MNPSIMMSTPIAIPTSLEHVQNTAGDTLSPNDQDIRWDIDHAVYQHYH